MYTLDYGFNGEMTDDDIMWETTPVDSLREAAKVITSMKPDDWEITDPQGKDVSREALKVLKAYQAEERAALRERKKSLLAS